MKKQLCMFAIGVTISSGSVVVEKRGYFGDDKKNMETIEKERADDAGRTWRIYRDTEPAWAPIFVGNRADQVAEEEAARQAKETARAIIRDRTKTVTQRVNALIDFLGLQ